ncbi:hypothetical protein BP5796_07564 [Coleophoma crateriformis]|uniref:Uncharacterized protein n=1 Tax=Coleophoma crateriformis TaxID=565419 RepID=A0A3D8RJA5_9HELO|nr:hypothetical protein BP5796_07564 [Coleophoma crateriformis]
MLAARDQENLVHGHQQVATSKPLNQSVRTLQPKTPGNRYPKTPLKIPIHDENAPVGLGGKSVLGAKGKGLDKNAFVTPLGPQTRAPLGMKTTNAKTKAFQTPAGPTVGKNVDKTDQKQASARRPTPKVTRTVKLDVHGDDPDPLQDREVEYAPPKPKDLPYESEDFPNNCLSYEALKPENRMRGWFDHYHNPKDEHGVPLRLRKHDEELARALREGDDRILRAIEETDWTVGDVPETFHHIKKKHSVEQRKPKIPEQPPKRSTLVNKAPGTLASRKAATALSVAPKSKVIPTKPTQPKPMTSFLARAKKVAQPPATSTMRHTAAIAASKNTLGYTKGRTASNAVNKPANIRNVFDKPLVSTMPRSVSNLSQDSDVTITPARFAQKAAAEVGSDEWHRMRLLQAFEVDDDELEAGLRGALPDCLRGDDDEEEEEFVMNLGF